MSSDKSNRDIRSATQSDEPRTKVKFLRDYRSDLRRGMLKLMILMLIRLRTEHAHGYGLIRLLQETGIELKAGTIYALLNKMEKDLLIESIPSTGFKMYTITNYGEKMIEEMVSIYTTYHDSIQEWNSEIERQKRGR